MKIIKRIWRRLTCRIRLRKIEHALLIRLTPKQRQVVLNPSVPDNLYTWSRGSGKTTVALIWTLLWRDTPVVKEEEMHKICRPYGSYGTIGKEPLAIPDPDINTMNRYNNVLSLYKTYSRMCQMAGIDVSEVKNR